MAGASDTLVLERARTGDREAFRMLVEEHSPTLFRTAYRMTGNRQDAEDVVQEALLRAYRRLPRCDSQAQLAAWLQRIAANRAIDLLRRRKRWGLRSLDGEADSRPLAATGAGPDRRLLGDEVARRLEEALETLTPVERLAFVLRHYEGRSIAEIGAITGARTNATKNRIFRAVRKVRRALEPLVAPAGSETDARR